MFEKNAASCIRKKAKEGMVLCGRMSTETKDIADCLLVHHFRMCLMINVLGEGLIRAPHAVGGLNRSDLAKLDLTPYMANLKTK